MSSVQSSAGQPGYRLLVCITGPRLGEKAVQLLTRDYVPLRYQFLAHGTANNEMRELLGLGSGEKSVVLGLVAQPWAQDTLYRLQLGLGLGALNSGIAFTVPVAGGSGMLVRMAAAIENKNDEDTWREGQVLPPQKEERTMTQEQTSALILAIVDQGYSEEVMAAARPVGARGGTVFSCRRLVDEEAVRFFGLSVQPEREIVMIVAQSPYKHQIMQAISASCGFHSPAHGLVLALPVEEAVGLQNPAQD